MGAPETPHRPRKNQSPAVGLATIAGFGLLLAAMAVWAFINPPGDRKTAPRPGPGFAPGQRMSVRIVASLVIRANLLPTPAQVTRGHCGASRARRSSKSLTD